MLIAWICTEKYLSEPVSCLKKTEAVAEIREKSRYKVYRFVLFFKSFVKSSK